ncbi:hypothetical protein C6N75_01575 [Streptomyces solincola]|uniref:Lipoprotein n=1 Tax=Streptomyces solincola TaxID=2100817 RepID=A0A2S9Q2Q2_9ACTN|nr:hypothetical protein [Streptomyces solincola]PRH80893.1 hypothetical protein C6N75_01575 [Streptomyces solincola]
MRTDAIRRTAACAAVLALAAGVSGCREVSGRDVDAGGGSTAAAGERLTRAQSGETIRAAYEKTAAAKSSKVAMVLRTPAGMPGGGGALELTEVQRWDPAALDVTVEGSPLTAGDRKAPASVRMVLRDEVLYADLGDNGIEDRDGRRWVKLDLRAAAEASGDAAVKERLTTGLENVNQDPARQLALLLESPDLRHVGAEKVDGVGADHYQGTFSVAETAGADRMFRSLPERERRELIAGIEESGVTAYDTEVWVGEDGYPVRMDVGADTPQGRIALTARYSDYGAAAPVQAPPAAETFDLFAEPGGRKGGLLGG